jgi:hypothetical protein
MFSFANMNFLMKFYRDRPGHGLPISSGLPGLSRVTAWPAWDRTGSEITACACYRQAGPGRQAQAGRPRQAGPGRQAGLVACLDLWSEPFFVP